MADSESDKRRQNANTQTESGMGDSDNNQSSSDTLFNDRAAGGNLESVYYSVVSHTTTDGRIIFGNNEIELFPLRELPEYATTGTSAYLAKDIDSNTEYVAMLCGRSELPRVSSIGSYRNMKNPNLLRLVAAGIVNWTPEARQRFALIFEMPKGKKILKSLDKNPTKIDAEVIVNSIIKPAIMVLNALNNMDLVHGAVRLDNMYMSAEENGSVTFQLGECLSSAPFYFQHAIYETPIRAMAEPAKRGIGTISDDLYALGICVAMLVTGKNFSLEKGKEEIAVQKLENGTHSLIVGKETFPAGIGEFLRGVLMDDAKQRWDIEDCVKWLEGRRVNPKQTSSVLISTRPFVFRNKEYFDLRLLADALSKHPDEAMGEINKGQLLQWLRRNFDNKDLKDRFEAVYQRDQVASVDRYICSICSAIDPMGPVRYRGITLFPSGFGVALSEAIKKGENLQDYVDLIKLQILSSAVNQIFEELPDAGGISSMLEKCRIALNQKILGYGLERALYIANPSIACISPYFDRHYVLIPGSLLLALEDISSRSQRPDLILDRHMIAFLSVREPKLIDQYMGYINSPDVGRRVVGVLHVLNGIQRRFMIGSVPGVTKWIVSLVQPAIENFHDKDLKEKINKEIAKVQNSGLLQKLVMLVDDSYVVQDDIRRFYYACIEYQSLISEKDKIEEYLSKKSSFGRSTGRQVAMIVSSVVSLITIALYSFIFFYSKHK